MIRQKIAKQVSVEEKKVPLQKISAKDIIK